MPRLSMQPCPRGSAADSQPAPLPAVPAARTRRARKVGHGKNPCAPAWAGKRENSGGWFKLGNALFGVCVSLGRGAAHACAGEETCGEEEKGVGVGAGGVAKSISRRERPGSSWGCGFPRRAAVPSSPVCPAAMLCSLMVYLPWQGCSGQGVWWPSSIFPAGSGHPNVPHKDQPTVPALPFSSITLHGPALLLYVAALPSPSSFHSSFLLLLLSRAGIATTDLPLDAGSPDCPQEAQDLSCSPGLSTLPPSPRQTGQPGLCFLKIWCHR